MTPKKIFLLSSLAFAVLCAVTLAYYLPKLRPEAEFTATPRVGTMSEETSPETHKPDLDREIVQSLPAQMADPEFGETSKTEPAPARPVPPAPTPAPLAKAEPDRKLIDMLKNPPIQFEISSANLTPSSRQYLDKLGSLLKEHPNIRVTIEGHTDSQDRLGKNQVLSEQRAKAVLTYLASKGVAPDRLTSVGFGGSQPIADNNTAEGRAKNRRIEFKIGS